MQQDAHVKAFRNSPRGFDLALRAIMQALGISDAQAGWEDWSRAAAEGAWF
jgi:hypothetical protein